MQKKDGGIKDNIHILGLSKRRPHFTENEWEEINCWLVDVSCII